MSITKYPGGTRPFELLQRCARLGLAMLALLQPDLALVLAPMVELLSRAVRNAPASAPAMLGVS
jgi:hypothetical protein